jgi:DNA-binding CsgD family transcriptional regulator
VGLSERMPMLEREEELAACLAALERAGAGHGGILAVEGVPGIGKTDLLRAVRDQAVARGARVLGARGVEVERELPFGGARQLLDPVVLGCSPTEKARLFSGAARPAARLLDGGVAGPGVPGDPAFAMLNALYWVLAGLADARPLLVTLDDAHWLDLPSLRLLDFLGPRIEELRALAVVAMRPLPDEATGALLGRVLTDPGTRVIRPRPLSRAAITEFVRARLGEEPDHAFIDACAEVTGGNPFYLTELVRELASRGTLPTPAEAAKVRSVGPRSIPLSLRFRGATSDHGMALAQGVAVLGDGAPLEQVAELAGLGRAEAAAAADALVRDSILAPGARLSFAHPIVRTAVYDEIPPHQRAAAHGRAAELLRTWGAPVDRVAAHLIHTDPARDQRLVEVMREAAAAAFAQGAPDTAAQYLRRALTEPPGQASRARVLLELGKAEMATADPDAAAHITEAHSLASDVPTRADAAAGAARLLLTAGRAGEAVAMLASVAGELARQDRDRALQVEAQLLALAMYEPSAAAAHLPRLDRIDEDLAGDSPGERMMLCHLANQQMWRSRDAARAAELAERALADGLLLAELGTEPPELNSAALTLICADRLEPAARLLDAAMMQARERGSRFGFGHVSFLRSELRYRQGALRDAEADARAALAVTIPSGIVAGTVAATGVLIGVLLERGALDEAATALTDTGLHLDELPVQPHASLLFSARGRLRIARGDVAGGLADLLECGHRNEQLEVRNPIFIPWRADAALAHRALGELDAARALAQEELAAADDWGTPGAIGSAQRLAALLSSGDEAITLLHEATAALGESPARLEQARALVDLGAALRRANRRAEARQPLTRGLDLANQCGATVLSRRALDELAATGARPRHVRLTGLDSLTASERRVAQMAACGLSNVEIAQALFVTRKTIEKHLGNTYTKLSVKTRADLALHLPREAEPSRSLEDGL